MNEREKTSPSSSSPGPRRGGRRKRRAVSDSRERPRKRARVQPGPQRERRRRREGSPEEREREPPSRRGRKRAAVEEEQPLRKRRREEGPAEVTQAGRALFPRSLPQEQGEPSSGPSTSTAPHAKRPCGKACLEKQYKKGALLGQGGFGSVYAGVRKADGLPVAMKYVLKSKVEEHLEIPGEPQPLPLEVALMKLVGVAPRCPHILQLLAWFDLRHHYVLVLERPQPCLDLYEFSLEQGGQLDEPLARGVLRQLLQALRHCQARGVLHRDIKPENILVQTDSQQVKLIDFGCGDLLQDCSYKEFAGTEEYAPPEWVLEGQYQAAPLTVWSLGVLLFNMVCGHDPFKNELKILEGRLRFRRGISVGCRNLIRWCLSVKPEKRPTLEQILLHP
uniref:non-specific serine/threonine protein kinase n=2 Tax=Lepisosteus oculatus TaxID=7918 RepID=W5M7H7_LEPOC